LKNAIDIGSRSYGKSVWNRKPAAVISASLGGYSRFWRQSLVFNNVLTMQQPEAYIIGQVHKLVTTDGKAADDNTPKFFTDVMATFAIWVKRIAE